MQLRLGSLFQNHLVLQRDRHVPVWGWGKPGERVEVVVGTVRGTCEAGPDGRWLILLPPQPAAGPLTLTVQSGRDEMRIEDAWVGEVWLASGQSNMEMKVEACRDAGREMAEADAPGIRVWTTLRTPALTPRDEVEGSWQVCTPATVAGFTAAGYFFARELQRELGVAVGILHSSWGGTVAEAWTSREGLLGDPTLRGFVDRLDRVMGPDGDAERAAFARAQAEWEASIPQDAGNAGEADGWSLTATPDDDWAEMKLPTGWQTAGHNHSGVFWFRRTIAIPSAWAGRDLELHIGACDKQDHTYFDGKLLGSLGMADTPNAWCMPRVYPIPGRRVQAGRRTVAVRVFSNIYQGGMVGPAGEMWLAPVGAAESERLRLDGAWRYRVEQNYGVVQASPPPAPYSADNPNTPTALFNGMIAPLIPYALRGFIWYQGESNAGRAAEYRILFPAMIRDWRRAFGQGELAFHFVQLANYMGVSEHPGESDWALLREAQRHTLACVPRTGMAVIIDIGEAADIHPKNKQEVGRRLAACALALDYGRTDIAGSSPLPASAWRQKAGVAIRFDGAANMIATRDGERVRGFALAGPDRTFHWAEGRLEGHDVVWLSCAAVAEPRWVRYAWADNPVCNLIGGTGLPASPFEITVPYGDWLQPRHALK